MNQSEDVPVEHHDNFIVVDTIVVGFGFSVIPLIRELEKSNSEYLVLSDGETVWETLEKNNRLDFDLVSSMHTSLYSFELVKRDAQDCYLTAKEFSDFQKKYRKRYSSNLIRDWVTLVENYRGYSLIYTKSGKQYKTTHLIIGTGFRRKITESINNFDFNSVWNNTVALTTFGDSGNLIVSKLVPQNNRVILISNGFITLDKLFFHRKYSYTLDQLEFHNLRYISRLMYGFLLSGTFLAQFLPRWLAKILFGDNLGVRYPETSRLKLLKKLYFGIKSSTPNGLIAIKYWPIDSYKRLFDGENLEKSIEEGYLLNDIAYFLDQGLVEIWPKEETAVDVNSGTISWENKSVKCDYVIGGDNETPNLPPIKFHRQGEGGNSYEYVYRNTYLGIIPKELSNVYFVGYTRPSSGGLVNIIEMQCLFIHKMITDTGFHDDILDDIEDKLHKYDLEYYACDEHFVTDHLVHYGFYTEDVASVMGIAPSVKDCRSIREVLKYYLFPNNAFKYRQEGPYKVEGAKELVEKIWTLHDDFGFLKDYILVFVLIHVCTIVMIGLLPMPVYIAVLLVIAQLVNPLVPIAAQNAININHLLIYVLLAGLVLTILLPNAWVPGVTLSLVCLLIFVGRKLGMTRVMFNDLKNKRSAVYEKFFERYIQSYNRVIARRVS